MALRAFIDWLGARLSLRILGDRIAEALREIALLWFVFANLDLLVEEKFTWEWSLKNSIACAVLWSLGAVLESLLEKRGFGR